MNMLEKLLMALAQRTGADNPQIPAPAGTNMITGRGPQVDEAANRLTQEDRTRLQQLIDQGKLNTDWFMNPNFRGMMHSEKGMFLSPASTIGLDPTQEVARTLAHELQHSRQGKWAGKSLPQYPDMVPPKADGDFDFPADDPYWARPSEIEARQHAMTTIPRLPMQGPPEPVDRAQVSRQQQLKDRIMAALRAQHQQ